MLLQKHLVAATLQRTGSLESVKQFSFGDREDPLDEIVGLLRREGAATVERRSTRLLKQILRIKDALMLWGDSLSKIRPYFLGVGLELPGECLLIHRVFSALRSRDNGADDILPGSLDGS